MMNLLTLKLNEDMEKMVKRNDLVIEITCEKITVYFVKKLNYFPEEETDEYSQSEHVVAECILKQWKRSNKGWLLTVDNECYSCCCYGQQDLIIDDYGRNTYNTQAELIEELRLIAEDEEEEFPLYIIRDGDYKGGYYFTGNEQVFERAQTPSDLFPATGMEVL